MSYQNTLLFSSLIFATSMVLQGCHSTQIQKAPIVQNIKFLTDEQPRLGIMAAFGQEADLLIEHLSQKHEYLINGRKFYTGKIGNSPVVITLSGISMTNAAMTTQMMIDHFNLKALVFSGIAGSLNPNLRVGDVVIASSWIAPNEVYYSNQNKMPSPCTKVGDLSCLGLELANQVSPFNLQYLRKTNLINKRNYQNVALQTEIAHQLTPVAYGEMIIDFQINSTLIKIINHIKNKTEKSLEPICESVKPNVQHIPCYTPKIMIGQRGVSSGSFLANKTYRDYLHEELSGDIIDMETTAVAHVAQSNLIPFIAFRSVSDLAGADSDPNVALFFGSGIAQRNAAKVTINFINEWANIKN